MAKVGAKKWHAVKVTEPDLVGTLNDLEAQGATVENIIGLEIRDKADFMIIYTK